MIKLNGHIVTPTIFPDKTSQVWKVEGISDVVNHILWDFENEAEVFHVLQLIALTENTHPKSTVLEMPTMPYARQDKEISNSSTFAGKVFVKLILDTGVRVITTDVHNKKLLPPEWKNRDVNDRIKEVIELSGANLICFPDQGAATRGYFTRNLPTILLDKNRNQLTGEIEGLRMFSFYKEYFPENPKFLIIDDLCDGGRTFIEAAKVLYNEGAEEVHLFTTHGIYSKGVEVLKEAGIKRVFNYKGEV